jgi:chromate transporter
MPIGLLWRIFIAFAKVGVFAYGGGPSMIPVMKQEVVEGHSWLTDEEFVDALALGNALPGPIATKMSAYIGFKLAGWAGAVMGLLGTVAPSALAMLALAALFLHYKDHPAVIGSLKAVRPAVVALLVWTVYDIWPSTVHKRLDSLAIAIASFAAITWLKIHPALVIAAAAILGIAVYR